MIPPVYLDPNIFNFLSFCILSHSSLRPARISFSSIFELYANARLIDESQLDLSKALVLSKVKIKNQANGMEMKYTLVAESEADLKSGKISVTSPIGKGLLGKKVGEIAEISVPNGKLNFEILEITRD